MYKSLFKLQRLWVPTPRFPGGLPMEERDEKLISHLIKDNKILKKCVEEHEEYEKQLEQYNKRIHLTTEESMKRKRIQKLKLAVRDQVERILAEHRRAQK
jgi:hypothetical protein